MRIAKGVAVALATAIFVSGGGVATSLVAAQPAQASSTQSEIDGAVAEILDQTNAERANVGLTPLKLNTAITSVAQNWTQAMATQQSMTHNPDYQTQVPQPWIRVGENVGQGYTKDTIVAAWMASPGHKANILGDFTHIGIGYWVDDAGRGWFTQDFGKYDTPALSMITNPVTTVGKHDFTTSWDINWNENVQNYKEELRSSDGTLLQTQVTTNPTVTFTNLSDLTTYSVSIVAQVTNALGETYVSPANTSVVTTLEDVPAIGALTNLALLPGETQIAGSWDAPTGVYGALQPYTVELLQGGQVVSTAKTTNTNYVFSELPTNTSYDIRVTATSALGTKTAISSAIATSKTLLSSVANVTAPTKLTVASDLSSVSPSWSVPDSKTGNNLIYTVTLSSAGKSDVVVTTASTSYSFKNLPADTAYTVKVQATVTADNGVTTATSAAAVADSRTLASAPAPTPTASPTPTSTASPSPFEPTSTVTVKASTAPGKLRTTPEYNTANISWDVPTDVVGNISNYTLTLKQAGKSDQTFTVNGTSYSLSGLTEGTSYTVSIVANVISVDGSQTATSPDASVDLQTFTRFTDSKYSSFPREVDWMKTAGISTGYWDGTYAPFGTVTREQMAAFMYRMAGRPAFNPTSPFMDARYSSFPLEVNWMKTAGISTGYWDGTYAPFGTVTREQMAAFMHRYAVNVCSVNLPVSKVFVDAKYSSFPSDVAWMGGAGISTGYWDGTYRPFDPVTREQMAAFMYRLNNYINANGGCHH